MDFRYWYEGYKMFKGDLQSICADSITQSPQLMKLINEGARFDVVITMGTCGSFLAHVFDTPTSSESSPPSIGGVFSLLFIGDGHPVRGVARVDCCPTQLFDQNKVVVALDIGFPSYFE